MTLIGTDPELMLVNGDGELKSALNYTRGRKDAPVPLESCQVLADNVNVEFNIPPSDTPEEFVFGIASAVQNINKYLEGRGVYLRTQTSATFPMSELEDSDAWTFGCTPDRNAWSRGEMVAPPRLVYGDGFRSCGGHIHVGDDRIHSDPLGFVRTMDAFVGIPAMLMDNDPTSPDRRRLYGGAGIFRPTSYGIEYRAPSNAWMSNPEAARIIAVMCFYAMEEASASTSSTDFQNAINNFDKQHGAFLFENVIAPRIPNFLANQIIELSNTPHNYDTFAAWNNV